MEKNTELHERVINAFDLLKTARDNAINTLAEIIRNAGGFIPTLQTTDKPRLVAFQDFGDGEIVVVTIYGLREYEGEVFLFTRDNLDNYEYENGYNFEYTYDFQGEDLEHINKALSDLANFSSIYDDCVLRSATIYSILAGLENYL